MKNTKKLYRSNDNRLLFGVCGGFAKYFNVDPLIFRLIFLVLFFSGGAGLLIYLVCTLIIPSEDEKNSVKAEVYEVGEKVKKITKETGNNNTKFVLGLSLVVLGIIYLFSNFFDLSKLWTNIWPIALILVGFAIIVKKK